MMCPACNLDGAAVLKSMDNGNSVSRRRSCPCGARWTTDERTVQGTLVASGGQGPPLVVRKVPSLAPNGHGGVGGGLPSGSVSGQIPLTSVPSEQSGSGSHSDRDPDRARSKAYPIAFELTWKATWGEGSKGAAHKAWIKAGRPTADQVKPAAAAYLAAKASSGEKTAHVSTWLNDGGHLQTEWRLSPLPTRETQPALRPAAPAPYHAPAKPVQADWSQIKPWPKEGKGSP